jgi:hypothetical protein
MEAQVVVIPVVPDTLEAEIRRTAVQGQTGQKKLVRSHHNQQVGHGGLPDIPTTLEV